MGCCFCDLRCAAPPGPLPLPPLPPLPASMLPSTRRDALDGAKSSYSKFVLWDANPSCEAKAATSARSAASSAVLFAVVGGAAPAACFSFAIPHAPITKIFKCAPSAFIICSLESTWPLSALLHGRYRDGGALATARSSPLRQRLPYMRAEGTTNPSHTCMLITVLVAVCVIISPCLEHTDLLGQVAHTATAAVPWCRRPCRCAHASPPSWLVLPLLVVQRSTSCTRTSQQAASSSPHRCAPQRTRPDCLRGVSPSAMQWYLHTYTSSQ